MDWNLKALSSKKYSKKEKLKNNNFVRYSKTLDDSHLILEMSLFDNLAKH